MASETFFSRLTRLFRSGPSIQRRIKGYDKNSYYDTKLIQGNYGYRAPAPFGFGRESSPFSTMGSYGILDRMSRYGEFAEMEYTPEIASALDVYADETAGGDDRGKSFHIYSDDINIKRALDELFYDVLNIEFNLRAWTRNLVKYGDFFLYNEVLPEIGVVNAQPIPVSDLDREEGYDEEDPYAVRFKWLTRGNVYLENWQVTHMRILGNDLFLPFGTSILEPARRIWRQLVMMEDAMLLYRVVRSPERRVFYIDVGNTAPNDIPAYMEATKATLRSNSIIDKQTGRMDMRYNPLSVDEDYYIPVRGTASGTKIDTLSGGQHVTATEDVAYIQSKLFSALKVPKPYLNYDENLSSKATLAQEDIRFSRTITGIQKIIIAEMTKLAMIHLYAKGFDGENLINFELKLSNPSSVAVLQKLELWATKTELAGNLKGTKLVDERWIQKNILELTDDDIIQITNGLYEDKIKEVQLDAVAFEAHEETNSTTDTFSPANYEMSGEDVAKNPATEDEGIAGKQKISMPEPKQKTYKLGHDSSEPPVKASPFGNAKKNRARRVGAGGRSNLASPDFGNMLNPTKNKSLRDVFDSDFLTSPTRRESVEKDQEMIAFNSEYNIPNEIKAIFKRMNVYFEKHTSKKKMLKETKPSFILSNKEPGDDELIMKFVKENENDDSDLMNVSSLKEVVDQFENDIDDEDDENIILIDELDEELE